ncbi:unnamed protein product [Clavelina lepadiformis]|uniref:CWH43-like N-terminal domain-containing protein n=1 Tax=Clavelina lepadiformis TaxID=159417 RepID=A0ABP0FGV6_CLALP
MKEALKSHMYWPLLFFILLFFGFFACYGISLSYQHVVSPPEWPFVSDTGARSPESTLFTLILSLASFMVLITMYLYYKYVIHHHHPTKLNTAAFVIGCIASFGVVLVGAFQWTVLLIPHLIGAFTAFIGAMIYGWLIVIISWRQLVPHVHGMAIVYCRLALVILGSAAIIISILLLIPAPHVFV